MRKRAATLIFTSALTLLHVLVVVVPVVASKANGEGQMGDVILFDLPLVLFLSWYAPTLDAAIGGSRTLYILTYCIGGTLMYAAIGALIGWIIDLVRRGLTTRSSERLMAVTPVSKSTSTAP